MSKKDWEIENSTVECTIYDFSCPYCDEDGYCHLIHPERDCTDY